MKQEPRTCLVCNCEKTMPLAADKLSAALGWEIGPIHTQLCRSQLGNFESALAAGEEIVVACTQESPLFQEVAEEQGRAEHLRFVNIREKAGWSADADQATPKIASLLKAAAFAAKPAQLKSITSDGMCLVYGSGQRALEIAKLLSDKLSVTLLLSADEDLVLPSVAELPIYRGDIAKVEGSFGAFSVTVNNYAPLMPSARGALKFVMPRDGATSNCSLILDLSGKTPLVTGHKHRDGYKRVDPGDPAAALRAVLAFSDMVGEFEKPLYVDYNRDICAHSRSRITGCSKCLDVCPAGAIGEAGDYVHIDSGICGGCGACHAVCPTGAIAYRYPRREDTIGKARAMLEAYGQAGGKTPLLLLHDGTFGEEMIAAMARFGRGLPANMLPLSMHEVTSVGHVEMAALLASGAQRIVCLANPNKREELDGLLTEAALANHVVSALGFDEAAPVQVLTEADPDSVETALWSPAPRGAMPAGGFTPVGSKRDIARVAFAKLHEHAPQKPDFIELPASAPYGRIAIDQAACTLCMACTSACPTAAMMDTPGEPKLRFTESACVQCGLCVKTCPENALSLEPRLNFLPAAMQPITLYEETPFNCVVCGKPFATKSTIERITKQLAGKQAMYADSVRSRLIEMCEVCRVEEMANSGEDPFALRPRPRVRTTEDYLAARKDGLSVDDFLMED
jgi:ferredoxin